MKAIDLTGQRFGRLVAVDRAPKRGRHLCWNCVCDCGNTNVASTCDLRTGNSKSCGCGNKEACSTHGMTGTPEHQAWTGMKQRCTNEKSLAYDNYGGRGIFVCDEWLNSFEKFYEDMGSRTDGMSLDRIDTNDGYYKDNCRWATGSTQIINQRTRESKTGVRGVHPSKGKFYGKIKKDGVDYRCSAKATIEEAKQDRRDLELKHFGYHFPEY